MKKSAWISFCGWAVVALGATVLGKAKALLDEAQATAGGRMAAFPAPATSEAWFCTAHGVAVCVADLDTHDTPHCSYVPSARVQVVSAPPAPSDRRAAPSVLGLGNA
jgi:hypothetical protein